MYVIYYLIGLECALACAGDQTHNQNKKSPKCPGCNKRWSSIKGKKRYHDGKKICTPCYNEVSNHTSSTNKPTLSLPLSPEIVTPPQPSAPPLLSPPLSSQ